MKKFIRHFVSFFLVAVMIVSSNITAFAANEKPVDSRFLPEITYTEDNTSTTRVPNLIPITVNPYYNKLVDARQTGIQWSSAEHLIGYPTAYRYAIAVNYNTACTPGAGSAIFLHCSTGGSTAGCISVSQSNMIRILQSLQGDTLIGIYQNSNSLY